MKPPQFVTNRYEVISQLGQGGMGQVLKVYDRLERNTVALKHVQASPKNLQFASKGLGHSYQLALMREFRMLASLRHPNIISVLDYGLAYDEPFFTMELLTHAETIDISASDILPETLAERLIQILEALRYLHQRDIIHRDLKPANIMVLSDGRLKVLDFGISVDVESARGRIGTLLYMAPETVRLQSTVIQSDFFALGVIAYQLITGEIPFKSMMDIVYQTPNWSTLEQHPLAPVVKKLLEKSPSDRYQTAHDCIHAIQRIFNLSSVTETIEVRESFLQASDFIGRDSELQRLVQELTPVKDGATSFVLIGGESGVGKSRLLGELRISALTSGLTVLTGQAIEDGGLPLQLWRNIVRRLLLMVDVTDLQASILKTIVPDIDDLLGRSITSAPIVDEKSFLVRLTLTIIDVIQAVQTPLVLLLEDLHWADASLQVLNQLLNIETRLSHVMVVATYRDDETPLLAQDLPNMTHMSLARLDRRAVEELSKSMLGTTITNSAVVDLLHRETEGNIFFLVETVRALAEDVGSLSEIGNSTLPNTILTGGMQAIMGRRLDKIDAKHLPIQQFAAVLGRHVDVDLLEQYYPQPMIERWLNEAMQFAIVTVQDNRWQFAHDKLRETMLLALASESKANLHEMAANSIENVYRDNSDYHDILMQHWRGANNLDKEFHYLVLVVRHKIEITGDNQRAKILLEAMRLRLKSEDIRYGIVINLLAKLEGGYGNYDISQDLAQQAYDIAQNEKNQRLIADTLATLGIIEHELGNYAQAINYHQQSLNHRQQLGDSQGISSSLTRLGSVEYASGNYQLATKYHQESYEISKSLGDQRGISTSLNNMGNIAYSAGDYDTAIDYHHQALLIYDEIGDQLGLSACLNNLANLAWRMGDYQLAEDYFNQSLDIKLRLGNQRRIAASYNNLGIAAMYQKEYDRATHYYQQSLDIFRKLGEQSGIVSVLTNLGLIAMYQGDYDHALAYHHESLPMKEQIGDKRGLSLSYFNIGWVHLRQKHEEASHWFYQGLTLANDMQFIPTTMLNAIGLIGALVQQGAFAQAVQYVGTVKNHQACTVEMLGFIDEYLPELEQNVSSDALADGLSQGESLDFDVVIVQLLDEFS